MLFFSSMTCCLLLFFLFLLPFFPFFCLLSWSASVSTCFSILWSKNIKADRNSDYQERPLPSDPIIIIHSCQVGRPKFRKIPDSSRTGTWYRPRNKTPLRTPGKPSQTSRWRRPCSRWRSSRWCPGPSRPRRPGRRTPPCGTTVAACRGEPTCSGGIEWGWPGLDQLFLLWKYFLFYLSFRSSQGQHPPVDVHWGEIRNPHLQGGNYFEKSWNKILHLSHRRWAGVGKLIFRWLNKIILKIGETSFINDSLIGQTWLFVSSGNLNFSKPRTLKK